MSYPPHDPEQVPGQPSPVPPPGEPGQQPVPEQPAPQQPFPQQPADQPDQPVQPGQQPLPEQPAPQQPFPQQPGGAVPPGAPQPAQAGRSPLIKRLTIALVAVIAAIAVAGMFWGWQLLRPTKPDFEKINAAVEEQAKSGKTPNYSRPPSTTKLMDPGSMIRSHVLTPINGDEAQVLHHGTIDIVRFSSRMSDYVVAFERRSQVPLWMEEVKVPTGTHSLDCKIVGDTLNCAEGLSRPVTPSDKLRVDPNDVWFEKLARSIQDPDGSVEPRGQFFPPGGSPTQSHRIPADGSSPEGASNQNGTLRYADWSVPLGMKNKRDGWYIVASPTPTPGAKAEVLVVTDGDTIWGVRGGEAVWNLKVDQETRLLSGFSGDGLPRWVATKDALIIGTFQGVRAYNVESGDELWRFDLPLIGWMMEPRRLLMQTPKGVVEALFADTKGSGAQPVDFAVLREGMPPSPDGLRNIKIQIPRGCHQLVSPDVADPDSPVQFVDYAFEDPQNPDRSIVINAATPGKINDSIVLAVTMSCEAGQEEMSTFAMYDKDLKLIAKFSDQEKPVPFLNKALKLNLRQPRFEGSDLVLSASNIGLFDGCLGSICQGSGVATFQERWNGTKFELVDAVMATAQSTVRIPSGEAIDELVTALREPEQHKTYLEEHALPQVVDQVSKPDKDSGELLGKVMLPADAKVSCDVPGVLPTDEEASALYTNEAAVAIPTSALSSLRLSKESILCLVSTEETRAAATGEDLPKARGVMILDGKPDGSVYLVRVAKIN